MLTLYKVSSHIDVLKHSHDNGRDLFFNSTSLFSNICKTETIQHVNNEIDYIGYTCRYKLIPSYIQYSKANQQVVQ